MHLGIQASQALDHKYMLHYSSYVPQDQTSILEMLLIIITSILKACKRIVLYITNWRNQSQELRVKLKVGHVFLLEAKI